MIACYTIGMGAAAEWRTIEDIGCVSHSQISNQSVKTAQLNWVQSMVVRPRAAVDTVPNMPIEQPKEHIADT